MSQTASDLIMGGGGAPAAKFPTVGTLVKGQIVETDVSQQRDFQTQKPKTWDDGSPMMQAVITLQTDDRDPAVEDDDGKRRLFVASKNMRDAVRQAVINAGQKQLQVGGTLAVQYTGDGVAANRGQNPPKEYIAEYQAPAIGVGLLGGNDNQPAPAAAERPTSLLGG